MNPKMQASAGPIRLDARAAALFTLQQTGVWLVFAILLSLWWVPGTPPAPLPQPGLQWYTITALGWALLRAAVLGIALVAGWSWLRARSYRVELRDQGLAIDYGVLSLRHEIMPYPRIQDVVLTRSLPERLLGLSTLYVQNAAGTPISVPALDSEQAEMLRDDLMERTVTR